MEGSETTISYLMIDLVKNIEDHEKDIRARADKLILILLDELKTIQQTSEHFRVQLNNSEVSLSEIIQYLENIQQGLKHLQVSLDVSSTSSHNAEETLVGEGDHTPEERKKFSQNKPIPWGKILLFILVYIFFELSSNAVANKWPVDTFDEWRLTLAIFLGSFGILTILGVSGLNEWLRNESLRNEN